MIEIVELNEQVPRSWSLGLSQIDYKLVNFMSSAAEILHFRLTPSIVPILKILQKLYSSAEEVI